MKIKCHQIFKIEPRKVDRSAPPIMEINADMWKSHVIDLIGNIYEEYPELTLSTLITEYGIDIRQE